MKTLVIDSQKYGRKFVEVSDEDFDRVSQHKWHLQLIHGVYYAAHSKTKKLMHRFILDVTDRTVHVDHKNGIGLDNTRENIRICTPAQNSANHKLSKRNKSGYKGVYQTGPNAFRASIKYGGRIHYLGIYPTAEGAACAYESEARRVKGEYHRDTTAGRPLVPSERKTKQKLTDEQITELRAAYRPYEVTLADLSDQYGISYSYVCKIIYEYTRAA